MPTASNSLPLRIAGCSTTGKEAADSDGHQDGRRSFIRLGSTTLISGVVSRTAFAQTPSTQPDAKKPPALPLDLLQEFVRAGHVDLDKTRSILESHPTVLNATWDWGNGDFEMAIGVAGHMGRRDISHFLIERGGRFDIYVAAMLRVDIVRAAIEAFPKRSRSGADRTESHCWPTRKKGAPKRRKW